MLRIRTALVPFLMLATLLSACGGGGGGSSGGGSVTPPPVTGPALSFTPATVSASVQAGLSTTVNISASVNRPADFANASSVFSQVLDPNGVLLPGAQLVRDSASQYHLALQTAPSLAAGAYQGNFTIKLCQDSGCASQFPGSPMSLPYSLTITPAGTSVFSATTAMPLTYSVLTGEAAPAPASISVKAGARSWSASANANWLTLSPASGNGDGTLTASINLSGLASASYSAIITVTASDGMTATVPVSLTILPPGFVFGSNGVTFTAINGAPIPTQNVAFNLNNGANASWTANSDSTWLAANPTSGTTPSSVILSVDPAGASLKAGTYTGNINFTSPAVAPRQLPVTLNLLKATLLGSATSITLGGPYGRDFSPQTWKLSLNTSTNSWPLSVGPVPTWITAVPAANNINSAQVGIVMTPNASSAPVGTSTGLVGALAAVNGDLVSTSAAVTLNKDTHKLIPSETGVAMVGTPGWARISRTLAVTDNYGQNTTWTAASDQPWLAVSTTASSVTLTVDPNILGVDTLSTANVTITPAAADVATPEVIRVAFWKGGLQPLSPTALPLPYTTVVADPVRPILYAHNGGAFVDVYHLYSQQKLATITGFSAKLGEMTTSPNGDRLYVIDLNNSALVTVDLNTRAITGKWPLPASASLNTQVRAIRPNGEELVVLSDGTVWQVSSGKQLASIALPGGSLTAPGDGKRLYLQDEGKSSLNVTTFSIDYAALAGGTLFAAKQAAGSHIITGSQGQDLAASPDGSKVYSASSAPAACSVLNPADLSALYYLPTNNVTPNNVEVGSDGRVYCGVAGRSNAADVWAYSASGALLQQIKFAPAGQQLVARRMAVSGDGFLLLGVTDNNSLYIVPIGP